MVVVRVLVLVCWLIMMLLLLVICVEERHPDLSTRYLKAVVLLVAGLGEAVE